MPVLTKPTNLGDVLKYEAPNLYSRERVTVLAGSGADRALAVGTAIGKRTKSSVVAAADAGNTGDGTFAATPTLGVKAEAGDYSLEIVTAAVDAGDFTVTTPSGYRLDDGSVGSAYANDHLSFTLDDGATDFAVGDKVTITVSGDGKVVALDVTAVDGTHEAYGIVLADVTAPDGSDEDGVAIVRDAVLADDAIVWPVGITQAQKDAAIAELAARGIVIRDSA